eukprot:Amastigsp_a511943_7.p3 type:complete len:160 gc:universal Amastigsp_a511943_7:467-946(+)
MSSAGSAASRHGVVGAEPLDASERVSTFREISASSESTSIFSREPRSRSWSPMATVDTQRRSGDTTIIESRSALPDPRSSSTISAFSLGIDAVFAERRNLCSSSTWLRPSGESGESKNHESGYPATNKNVSVSIARKSRGMKKIGLNERLKVSFHNDSA